MAEKGTTMVLNVVDLQCSKCYKKVKKLLCKFPEIRDQTYDEKANKVTIKVVSDSPEKIRDKLCCKACGCIKSIEIVEKPPPPPPPPPPPETVEVSVDLQVQGFCYCTCCGGRPWGPCSCGGRGQCCKGGGCTKSIEIKKPDEKKPDKKEPKDKSVKVSVDMQVQGFCWGPYGHCGRPICDCWGWGCYRCDCAYYCIEENPNLCTIM